MATESSNTLLIGIFGLAAVACGVMLAHRRVLFSMDPYADRYILRRGMGKPIIWIFYNDSDPNSRLWRDFGARNGHALNLPFLNLCYETVLKHNNDKYTVEVIGGLTGAAERLGLESLPVPLRNNKKMLVQADIDFIRSAILAKFGGLWLTPGAICRKGFGELPKDKNVFFGTDLDDTFSGPDGTNVPGMRAIWACKPDHPTFVGMEAAAFKRIEAAAGGGQIRNDAKWDFMEHAAGNPDTLVRADAELGRKGRNGKRIELDDLLAAGGEGVLPFALPAQTIYTPIPLDEVERRRSLEWFAKMSEEQILGSDLAVSRLFKEALGRN